MQNTLTAALRSAHKAVLAQVKAAVPIGPQRHGLLKRLDEIAAQIRAAEKKANTK